MAVDNGVITMELDTEVWYRIELSSKGDNDWCVMNTRAFDTMIAAKSALDRHIANVQDTDDYDYRLVRVTTNTEVVRYS